MPSATLNMEGVVVGTSADKPKATSDLRPKNCALDHNLQSPPPSALPVSTVEQELWRFS